MTLKEQERLFTIALFNSLNMEQAHLVTSNYLSLKSASKSKVELEKVEVKTEKKIEVNKKHIEQSTDYLERKEEKKEE